MSRRWTLLGRQLEIWVEKDGVLVRQISLLPHSPQPRYINTFLSVPMMPTDQRYSRMDWGTIPLPRKFSNFYHGTWSILAYQIYYTTERWRFEAPPLPPFQIPSYAPVPTLQQQLEKHFQRTALVHKEPALPKAQSYHPPQFPNSFLENSSVLPSTAKAKNIVLFVEIIKYVCSTGSAVLKKNGSTTFIVSYGYAP